MAHRYPMHPADKYFERKFGDGRALAHVREQVRRNVDMGPIKAGNESAFGAAHAERLVTLLNLAVYEGRMDAQDAPLTVLANELFALSEETGFPDPDDLYLYEKWGSSRQVLKFDDALSGELARASRDLGEIAPSVFETLPYETFFVEAKGLRCPDKNAVADRFLETGEIGGEAPMAEACGFFVTKLNLDKTAFASEEQIMIAAVDSKGAGIDSHILSCGMASIDEMLEEELGATSITGGWEEQTLKAASIAEKAAFKEAFSARSKMSEYLKPAHAAFLKRCMGLLAYLCTPQREMRRDGATPKMRARSRASAKAKPNIGETPVYVVGSEFGAAMRAYSQQVQDGTRSVRPHIRRGHFHSYWTGPIDSPDARKLVVKWVEPVFVNKGKGGLSTTGHSVKAQSSQDRSEGPGRYPMPERKRPSQRAPDVSADIQVMRSGKAPVQPAQGRIPSKGR